MNDFRYQYKLEELKIEVTHKCNLACIHCSSDSSPLSANEMTTTDCNRIIHEAIDMGIKEIVYSGGEPLIWPGIEEAVSHASNGGLSVTIYTSGNVENIETKLHRLKHRGANRLVFSVFGSTASRHEKVTRIKDSFDNTLRAVSIATTLGMITEFHFVPLSYNYTDLPNIIKLANKIGINRVSVLRLVPQGRGYLLGKGILSHQQNLELRKIIIDLRKSFDVRTGSPYNFLLLNDTPHCMSAINRLIIGPDLRIYPCDAFKQIKAEEVVGTLKFSILSDFSLSDCWERSPFLLAVREYLSSNVMEPCSSCIIINKCKSGCLAQKVIAYGELTKKADPDCIQGEGVQPK